MISTFEVTQSTSNVVLKLAVLICECQDLILIHKSSCEPQKKLIVFMIADNLKNEEIDIDKVVERLSEKLGVTSDRALSTEMGLSLGAVNQARKRGSLPYEAIIKLCQREDISLDWLFGTSSSKQREVKNQVAEPEHTYSTDDKELMKVELISINQFVEEVLDQVLDRQLPTARLLEVRKALAPILIDAVIEYGRDKAIVAAVARSTLKLI
ncbi:hypothetical protein D0N37_09680 [Pseudoalteromonas piscicida]|nr:hypothetical protein D0N37_09680 [Pseudoalteromonas piscicida]